jgi:hypothetical protein
VVHHDRKAGAEDVFDSINGTLGLNGATDTMLLLKRREGGATMSIRGRDVEDVELALQFSKATCRWTIIPAEVRDVEREHQRRFLAERKSVRTIARETGIPKSTISWIKQQTGVQDMEDDEPGLDT